MESKAHRISRDGNENFSNAGVAQLVEQLICNQPVTGSTPVASSITIKRNGKQLNSTEVTLAAVLVAAV